MQYRHHLQRQIQANLVAIISLVTALSGVFYDTWRDHRNELNENRRNAAFEVLKNLGELQTIVNYAHFKMDSERGNPIEGWKYVLLIRDLTRLLPEQDSRQGNFLYTTWQQHWVDLESNQASEKMISDQISIARTNVLATITDLQ